MHRRFLFILCSCALTTVLLHGEITYSVLPGDTLWKIGHAHGCTIEALKTVNHLESTSIHPGQLLLVPEANSPASAPAEEAVPLVINTVSAAPVIAPDTTILGDDPRWDKSSPLAAKTEAVPESSEDHQAEETPPATIPDATSTHDWATRFLEASRDLAGKNLDYNDSWRPPGEENAWVMDCSNTCRYLYKSVAAIMLPRCASDQYEDLRQQDAAWDVPTDSENLPDLAYLKSHLQPGDLLFWENTYKPERDPPITHVMIFLGTNVQGKWIMSGCQGGPGGHYNRRHGGPDIYFFNPQEPSGGYTSWFVHHTGRFCAYGRPLAADAEKLALAASH